ncbi:23S rRNA (adenine(2030)-N(6))-methyltransferase RlmJ [Lichenicoccus roseus]|uniref:Ribosomal RNA large subunit methyltransferase J n=1 Tax=Lichenicoccus roseus TaxID=2683649 RepID=A0A5R9J7V9_9PROT|nr:23S rRNA (adenine(2030)-N(6))-methyltransferase RlmJ [Lichenicoccus roseus]TLU73685.1 23S rRNA (adenine(2030)-N(6))-methyltransferase RlmJ [Lichenicoccus roseus]
MNYRHAYHAGNFADCMKHALLVWLLRALARKPAAFGVLDTHAGAGGYDLQADEATRTGEWQQGIGRLLASPPDEALADYLGLVRAAGAPAYYPGSPRLVRALLRPQDRLVCCEMHGEDHAGLRRLFARDPMVAVHARDGWTAIEALLPPRTARRGLTLIDPPFEQPGEFDRIVAAIGAARRRFAAGVVAAWYPIKHRAPVRDMQDRLRAGGEPDLICAELLLRPPLDPSRLNGCGLLVASPPWGFEAAAAAILDAIADRLGRDESAAHGSVTRLTPELPEAPMRTRG